MLDSAHRRAVAAHNEAVSKNRIKPLYNAIPYQQPPQSKGPFDFLGNWIQSSDWFPVEINVPDTITGVGNGVGSFATNVGNGFNTFAQNVGNGFQTFTQNVGSGFQSFTQNLAQRIPILAVIVRPNSPPRYFLMLPAGNMNNNGGNKQDNMNNMNFNPIESDILESFP
ncbi:hypothetical protein NQ318_008865 [Aromia moschata]|uniref:Uncharacterized protein n=1 Tax=Aromia moschata TaxID=1265417 RepID=A0AAV8ZC88_9CUCU|nr:hypothetical protein NQ318_008865 [Aromia moschata]